MPRWVTILVGIAVVALAIGLVARNSGSPSDAERDPRERLPSLTVDSDGGPSREALRGPVASSPTDDGGAPLLLSDLLQPTDARVDARAGSRMLDGSPVPPIPATAPREVRFGVVLVSYDGAQPSATGNHVAHRTKADARVLADKLAAAARADFHAAVQQGDVGSADDVGRVKVGILEPAPEYILFTLPVDGVGGPVETPRGYWIVKRLE